MRRALKPKWTSVLLLGGTLLMVGGGAFAAMLPASGRSHGPAKTDVGSAVRGRLSSGSSAATTTRSSTGPRSISPPVAAPVLSTISYKVLRGDSLPSVAQWFSAHGYGVLFSINESVLRTQPQSLHPGERITITNGVMSVRSVRKAAEARGST